ncbi:hypothetical protein UWK_02867 [Desulfocapsa sulfexigens DSM 10523]|uniref:DUF3943 domain-containing protein n=1 Tax=Desulfocapsa sulfexigens (strain DSM 10523 / SB164P1) TaxID=1167006 RepID=M1P7F3_DESSD|nr:DUF3943 domain-containing protein [Desulfocapsa sulfexigens]AGF79398.1 hypothetical protein UWK_02867 [Desulfocapsa sulfexigens DSM 10523]
MIRRNSRYRFSKRYLLLIFCLLLLVPRNGQAAAANMKEEGNSYYSSNRYLSDPDLKELFRDQPKKDTFDLNVYYDSLEPPHQDGLLGRYSVLMEDSFYFLIPAFTVLGVLYLMPEGVSNWDCDEITWNESLEDWNENVSSWRMDPDEAWINFVGHPYFGSTYFIYARHYGYSRLESLFFSFAISSVYEIGLEAWAEPVSIQDMIVTPLLGWGLAEVLLPIEHHIKENKGRVFNSRILGATALFLVDPFGHVVPPLKRWMDSLFSSDTKVSFIPTYSRTNRITQDDRQKSHEERYGFQLTIQW